VRVEPGHLCDVSPVPCQSSSGIAFSRRGLPGIQLPAPVACLAAAIPHARPRVGIRRRPAQACSARISCARKLFSCCCGILEIRLDHQRERTSSAKTTCRRRATGAKKITAKPRSRIRNAPLRPCSPPGRNASPVNAHPDHFGLLVELSRSTRMTCARIPGGKVGGSNVSSHALSSHGGPSASSGEREVIEVIEPMVS
jgi:hypothetical protein